MKIFTFYENYFSISKQLRLFHQKKVKSYLVAILTLASYATIVIPTTVFAAYKIVRLVNYFKLKRMQKIARKRFNTANALAENRANYRASLSSSEKREISFFYEKEDRSLEIAFKNKEVTLTIDLKPIEDSKADFIVFSLAQLKEEKKVQLNEIDLLYGKKFPKGNAVKLLNEEAILIVDDPSNETELYQCYFNSLELAHKHQAESIAFPLLGDSLQMKDAEVILKAVYEFSINHPKSTLEKISTHYLKKESFASYMKALS